eukprot:scaffold25376_cov64-Phaeocystis_antarctica.AAC.1
MGPRDRGAPPAQGVESRARARADGSVHFAGLICGDCATDHRGTGSAHGRLLAADVAARARQARPLTS